MADSYRSGTDLRSDEGSYTLPAGISLPTVDRDGAPLADPLAPPAAFQSVTTVLYRVTNFSWAWSWWIAEHVYELAEAARSKSPVRIWHQGKKEMVEVSAGHILCNVLPEEYGKNAGMHWVKNAGARELERRANRGTIFHDVALDWALGLSVSAGALHDYLGSLIEGHGYAMKVDVVEQGATLLIRWLRRHIRRVVMAEAPVFRMRAGAVPVAGTCDLLGEVQGLGSSGVEDGALVRIDFKGSKDWKLEHFLQAVTYDDADYVLIRGLDILEPNPRADQLLNVYINESGVSPYLWDDSYRNWAVQAFDSLAKCHEMLGCLEAEMSPRLLSGGRIKV